MPVKPERIAVIMEARKANRVGRIQTLWGGYGEVARYLLDGGHVPSVVVKHVKPGEGRGRSHDRKLRSYEVEQLWYEQWAEHCGPACRVAQCFHVERDAGEWLFVLEDLDAAGFPRRRRQLTFQQLVACLQWLAALHAWFCLKDCTGRLQWWKTTHTTTNKRGISAS